MTLVGREVERPVSGDHPTASLYQPYKVGKAVAVSIHEIGFLVPHPVFGSAKPLGIGPSRSVLAPTLTSGSGFDAGEKRPTGQEVVSNALMNGDCRRSGYITLVAFEYKHIVQPVAIYIPHD